MFAISKGSKMLFCHGRKLAIRDPMIHRIIHFGNLQKGKAKPESSPKSICPDPLILVKLFSLLLTQGFFKP